MFRIVHRIFSIGRLMADRNVSLWKKVLVIGGIIYLISPFELVADFILPFGLADDIILWICIFLILGDDLDRYKRDKRVKSKKYKGRDIIEDVEFEVKES